MTDEDRPRIRIQKIVKGKVVRTEEYLYPIPEDQQVGRVDWEFAAALVASRILFAPPGCDFLFISETAHGVSTYVLEGDFEQLVMRGPKRLLGRFRAIFRE